MKKKLCVLFISVLCVSMSSCEVHFGNKRTDVPWWVIGIFVAAVVILAIAVVMKTRMSTIYTCPKCDHNFTPKWYNFSALLGQNGDILIKCPSCKNSVIAVKSTKN